LANDDGEVLSVRCGCSDRAMCRGCAELYRGDVRTLVREALGSGPATFITFTGPGAEAFGQVHSLRVDHGRVRRCSCGRTHDAGDPILGTPLHPDRYRYDRVAEWNAHSRRLLTVVMGKVARLVGRKLEWVAVLEPQGRGVGHWHVLVRGVIPAYLVQVAVRGGVNRRTGRCIQQTHHAGYSFGERLDVQPILSEDGAGRAAGYLSKYLSKTAGSGGPGGELSTVVVEHWTRLADAARRVAGGCSCGTTERRVVIDEETGEVSEVCEHHPRPHGLLPAAILERMAPWGGDRCPRLRRVVRQGGHSGRPVGRSRGWGVSLSDLRARRREHMGGRDEPDESSEVVWSYIGRGYGPEGLSMFDIEACAFLGGLSPPADGRCDGCPVSQAERIT